MCDPTLFMVAQGAGAVSSAYGSYTSAKASKAAAGYNAAVNDLKATDAITRGEQAVVQQRMQVSQLKGSQIASMAANGVALDGQSALDIFASTDALAAIDEATTRQNAQREAEGYRRGAELDRYQQRSINPTMSAVSSLLGSSSRVADSWYRYSEVAV